MPSPEEYRDLLEARLHERWSRWQVYDAYYEGDHRLAFATTKFREAFGTLFAAMADNWMPMVVDSSVERLEVQGFRFGTDADDEAWAMWQANNLDAISDQTHTEAVKLGESYWLVEPGPDVPRITAEHPSQTIVAYAPGDRRTRVAALKKWNDDENHALATLYLPDKIYKWRSEKPLTSSKIEWVSREGGGANKLGEVPVIPLQNNPSMLRGGSSDLSGGAINIQNAVNKLLSDLLIGSEYQAYPQRVLMGVEPPRDPETGKILRHAELRASQSRLWYFPDSEVKVDEFSAADLDNFVKAIQHLVRHLTAQTRTPPHYVIGEIVNASGDALKAAETGLVSKVRRKMKPFGEAHEDAIRLAFRAQGDTERANALDAETIWRDPESRSQAETVDAAVKLSSIGVPNEVLWSRVGFSPQEINRMKAMQEADAFLSPDATQPAQPPAN